MMQYYTEQEARALIIDAGHRLLKKKLVARTWGNISARISPREFLITPSGREYDSLTPEELVKVSIDDLSYEGTIKPSSEKGVHADAYGLRPEVRFIIHTHQLYASAVGNADTDLPFAPCAHYALPGTGKLRRCLCEAMAANRENYTFLMARHGALCLGRDCEDAFALAERLEEDCRAQFALRCDAGETEIVSRYCRSHRLLPACIDDFAQIVGPCAFIRNGKVCMSKSDDEEASALITLKNCAAALYAPQALSLPDAILQRVVYLTKYSKQKQRNRK